MHPAEFNAYRDDIKMRKSQSNDWDGRAEWQPTKHALSVESDDRVWAQITRCPARMSFYAQVMALDDSDQVNHFLRQCARIPIEESACPRKIGQIALNIGQLLATSNVSQEQAALIELFIELGMTEYEAYV